LLQVLDGPRRRGRSHRRRLQRWSTTLVTEARGPTSFVGPNSNFPLCKGEITTCRQAYIRKIFLTGTSAKARSLGWRRLLRRAPDSSTPQARIF
jgi:hypothetical protein